MDSEPMVECVGAERLVDYFHGYLTDAEARAIEEHLADCSACVDLARRVRTVSREIGSWTARSHGEAYRRAQLADAVAAAATGVVDPGWSDRLRRWTDQCAGQASAAIRLVKDVRGRAARLATEGLDGLLQPGGFGPFAEPAAAGGAVMTRGAIRTRGAVRTRGGAVTTKAGPNAGSLAAETRAEGGAPVARVAVRGDALDVTVRNWRSGQPPPLVILIPADPSAGPPVLVELRRGPDASELTATFASIGSGDYVVAIEPAAELGGDGF